MSNERIIIVVFIEQQSWELGPWGKGGRKGELGRGRSVGSGLGQACARVPCLWVTPARNGPAAKGSGQVVPGPAEMLAGSCQTTSPGVLDVIPGTHWPCKGFGSGWRELGLAQSTQTALLLWGWGWGCARLQGSSPGCTGQLHWQSSLLLAADPMCSFLMQKSAVHLLPQLTYLPRKKSIAEKACFASNSCYHRRLLKNKKRPLEWPVASPCSTVQGWAREPCSTTWESLGHCDSGSGMCDPGWMLPL